MVNEPLVDLRKYMYKILSSGNAEEVHNLLNFIVNGVLIGKNIVIDLPALFPPKDSNHRATALDFTAREEKDIIVSELSTINERFNNFSYLEIDIKDSLRVKFYFLFEEENVVDNKRFMLVKLNTEPSIAIIFVALGTKINYVCRLVEGVSYPFQVLNTLNVNIFREAR
jgi:hypothetical protein